jgi:protein-serine/threonine kinase
LQYATTPFKGSERNDTFANIRMLPVHFRDAPKVSSAGKDCITRLLDKNERTRLGSKTGASEVKQHKWFSKVNWGLLRNMAPPVSVTLHVSDEMMIRRLSPSKKGAISAT